MICLGIEVDINTFCLFRLDDLFLELTHWKDRTSYRLKELQCLLGKLSFITACVCQVRLHLYVSIAEQFTYFSIFTMYRRGFT